MFEWAEASGKEGKMLKTRGMRADLHVDMLMHFATANDLVMILTWFTYYYFCDSFFSLMMKKINLAQSSTQRCVRCAFSSAFVTPWDLNSPWGGFQFRFAPWRHKRRAEQALSCAACAIQEATVGAGGRAPFQQLLSKL